MRVKRTAPAQNEAAVASGAEAGVRPVVRLPRSGPSGAILTLGALLAAIFLFVVLEARRNRQLEPAIKAPAADLPYAATEPPPFQIPPPPPPAASVTAAVPALPAQAPQPLGMRSYWAASAPTPAPAPPSGSYFAQPSAPVAPAAPPARNSSGAALVIDATAAAAAAPGAPAAGAAPIAPGLPVGAAATPTRARSGMLANRANTVPQGTLIPAVLETAFDSTRPGFARAIVSRDVRGFDGSKVLIPRGSRLVGQYQSDASIGQKRAVITWTRLMRPDGAVIALESPAVDTLGRGGVRASVNNHIPQRVLDALLQSTFQIGGALATRAATGSVVVALPNTLQSSVMPPNQSATIVPTLQVPAATSISIFVARDLEFNGEDGG